MPFLLANWRICCGIAIFAIYSAFLYRIGGNAPRAELAALRAAGEAYKVESARIAKETDNDYRTKLAAVQSDWDAYRLRNKPAKAVRVSASLCDNEAANEQLSGAITDYIDSVGRFREEITRLLEQASSQTAQLDCAVNWAQTINR